METDFTFDLEHEFKDSAKNRSSKLNLLIRTGQRIFAKTLLMVLADHDERLPEHGGIPTTEAD